MQKEYSKRWVNISSIMMLPSMPDWIAQVAKAFTVASWSALKIALTVTTVFLLAVFFYGTIYYAYVPQSAQQRVVFFEKVIQHKEQRTASGSAVLVDRSCLRAILAFQSGDLFLVSGLSYRMRLLLQLPESDVNQKLGTFMINTTLYDKEKKVLLSSRRLVMLRYRSWLLRVLDLFAYLPFYLLGFMEEVQYGDFELLKDFQDSFYKPLATITIEIDDAAVQLYEAQLIIQVQFAGLRYWMYHWPIVSAFMGSWTIAILLMLIIAPSWNYFGGWRANQEPSSVLTEVEKPSIEYLGADSSERALLSRDLKED